MQKTDKQHKKEEEGDTLTLTTTNPQTAETKYEHLLVLMMHMNRVSEAGGHGNMKVCNGFMW